MNYKPVIGLEVHVELKTKSKMFCGCANDWFGQPANTHTCPVCLGLPGALPVPNRKALEWCVMIGMALGCHIPITSKFDRKNYFYPDLAKGYQISQYDQPFAINGSLKLKIKNEKLKILDEKTIRIRRAHMEEDTGKLIHETLGGERVSLIDFNRSGVPLVEIVTEPDFENAIQVKEYLQKLQQIVRYLGVSNADMEKGEMRLEPNISLRPVDIDALPGYKVEVKNINSFNFVERAINFEIERQAFILDEGDIPLQETRGWDEGKKATVSQRVKEEAADYRYFPEPDIPPIIWGKEKLDEIRSEIPELPDEKFERYTKEYNVSASNAAILVRDFKVVDYFEEAVRAKQKLSGENITVPNANDIANWIVNKKVDIENVLPAQLIAMYISSHTTVAMDSTALEKILKMVIDQNPQSVADYKKGKTNAIMFLVGQAMKEAKGKVKAETVRQMLEDLLK